MSISGSSEQQQSLPYKFQKPFSGSLERAKEELAEIGILEGMEKFRNDLEDIYTDEVDVDATPETKRQWALAAKSGLDNQVLQYRRIEWGLDFLEKLKLLRSVVALFVLIPVLSTLGLSQSQARLLALFFAVLVYLINVGLPYGQVFVNHVGYQRPSPRSAGEVVKFRAAWNKGVMNSASCTIGIFIVAVLALRADKGYEWALRGTRKYLRWRA